MYGSSDDLIEFSGNIYEEKYPNANEWTHVAFSNGLLARIKYDGNWIIRMLQCPKDVKYHLGLAGTGEVDEKTYNDYTDVLTVFGEDVIWVVVGEAAGTNGMKL